MIAAVPNNCEGSEILTEIFLEDQRSKSWFREGGQESE